MTTVFHGMKNFLRSTGEPGAFLEAAIASGTISIYKSLYQPIVFITPPIRSMAIKSL